ncbi:MAG: hypothetical protein RR086_05835 [Clostridia bacterium]
MTKTKKAYSIFAGVFLLIVAVALLFLLLCCFVDVSGFLGEYNDKLSAVAMVFGNKGVFAIVCCAVPSILFIVTAIMLFRGGHKTATIDMLALSMVFDALLMILFVLTIDKWLGKDNLAMNITVVFAPFALLMFILCGAMAFLIGNDKKEEEQASTIVVEPKKFEATRQVNIQQSQVEEPKSKDNVADSFVPVDTPTIAQIVENIYRKDKDVVYLDSVTSAQINRLKRLRDLGALTESEYARLYQKFIDDLKK